MSDIIPYGRQDINQDDINAIIKVLKSDFLTQGPTVALFEDAVAKYCGAAHAVAANSATSALHIACLALNLGPGDSLWTTPITFVASANCGLYCGAHIDFVDIDKNTYNMCPNLLEKKLVAAEKKGMLPKIVIPVHLAGHAADMEAIWKLSQKYGFKIIEDASHAIGGKYQGQPIGNSKYSDITVFSFHPVKIITTAEGGMAVTNSKILAKKMQRLRSHGITREPNEMASSPDGDWYYQQIDLGYNYRITDLQAALGISQLERIDKYIACRHIIAEEYGKELKSTGIKLPTQTSNTYSAYHLYIIRVEEKNFRNRGLVFDLLRKSKIGVNVHYIPVHLQPFYKDLGFKIGDFPNAEAYYKEAISLPIYPGLTSDQQEYIIKTMREIIK